MGSLAVFYVDECSLNSHFLAELNHVTQDGNPSDLDPLQIVKIYNNILRLLGEAVEKCTDNLVKRSDGENERQRDIKRPSFFV
jgi:hypothetical protein